MIAGVAAATGASLLAGAPLAASAAKGGPEGSVADAPDLPDGFTKTFKGRFVQANGIRQHRHRRGGPPLLLVHGWPENWYAWRFLMPTLAKNYTVVAVDQRGIGLTEKTTRRLRLRHPRHRPRRADDRARPRAVRRRRPRHRAGDRLRAGRRPPRPGRPPRRRRGPRTSRSLPDPTEPPPPPMFVPELLNNKLWHIPFNRVNDELIIDMVKSNANAYYRYEYADPGRRGDAARLRHRVLHQAVHPQPEHPARQLRALPRVGRHMAQNGARQATALTIPVLGIGGVNSWGTHVAEGMCPPRPACRPPSSPAPATGSPSRRPRRCSSCSAGSWLLPRRRLRSPTHHRRAGPHLPARRLTPLGGGRSVGLPSSQEPQDASSRRKRTS